MRFRKPDHCYFCGKELRWREETHSDHAPRNPQAPPSVAPPPTDGSLHAANRIGRAPGSGRPDVCPRRPKPPKSRRDYIQIDPEAVRESLISLHARGFSVATLARMYGKTPRTIRQWMTRREPPESDDRT